MQPKIYLLTGAVQTGKTTSLMQWCKGKKNVSGILAPVINAKRMFLDIGSEEVFAMEADEAEIDVLKVGRFAFSASAFEKAKKIIAESKNCNYLVEQTDLSFNPTYSPYYLVGKNRLNMSIFEIFSCTIPLFLSSGNNFSCYM